MSQRLEQSGRNGTKRMPRRSGFLLPLPFAGILPVVALLVLLLNAAPAAAQGFFRYVFTVTHLNDEVNSPEHDYSPMLNSDGTVLYFTSNRKDETTGKADIYTIPRSGTEWGRSLNADAPLNGPGDDGSPTFSGKGEFMVFAADDRNGGSGKTDLYVGLMERGTIVSVQNLGPEINSRGWDSQPALSGDGQSLYFASDRPGGQGGTDIWVARLTDIRQDGMPVWGKPENLGGEINTAADERSPFIAADGTTLYFASNGLEGFGGFDLYTSIMELGEWSKPLNLGQPINSPADEMFFSASPVGRAFFFASSRPGGKGKLDIYSGTPNVFGAGLFHATFNVVDSTDRPLPGAITIADPATGDTVATILTTLGQLDYEQQLPAQRRYRVTATVPGRPPRTVDLEPGGANETRRVRLSFNAFTVAEFDLAKYNIPFFVSGYYRPNISSNLESLFGLRQGKLKKATYIEKFSPGSRKHREYRAYARIVDTVFGAIYRQAVDEVFSQFEREAMSDEVLEIRVTGLADPQPFVGTYYDDETATFIDTTGAEHTVKKGDKITNLELSGLRAWYSAQLLDRLFALSAQEGKLSYGRLKEAGKIRLKIIGGSAATADANYETQRRIGIAIVRVNGASELEFNLDETPFR